MTTRNGSLPKNRSVPLKRARPIGRRRALHFGVGAALAFGVGQAAIAQTDWTPEQNTGIAVAQGSLLGAHIFATGGGLLAGPLGTPFEISALAFDVALKATPPTLRLPADLEVSPNRAATGVTAPFNCVYRFDEAIPSDSRTTGIETDYGSIFFIPYNPLDDVWADLNEPSVFHPHASANVTVDNPFLSRDGYAQHSATTRAALEKLPEFPEGTHELEWQAGTQMNYLLDIAVPAALIAVFWYAEHQLSAKASTAAAKQAGKKPDWIIRAVGVAAELGLIALDVTDAFSVHQWYKDTSFTTAINAGTQTLTVWDTHVPYLRDPQSGGTHFLEQNIQLEATDFGGVRFGRVTEALRARFEPVDSCGRKFATTTVTPPSTLLKVGAENIVTWDSREVAGGPYAAGVALASNQRFDAPLSPDNIVTTLTQRVTVVDTQAPILVAPAGFARSSATAINLSTSGAFPLGRPLVVDLADPAPSVRNNAPPVLDVGRRYLVDWQATDSAGNTTPPARQVVTVKAPGTNTAPTAQPSTAATLTSRPVEILLTGVDTDLIDGRVDPLAFEIEQYPPNGQFEAPLLPYFIDDFRLSPVGEREDGQTLVRTSPLKHLANAFRLADPVTHGTFLTTQICNAASGTQNLAEFNRIIPVDFVYEPTYVHVDDDGFYYIRDMFWICGEPDGRKQFTRPTLSPIPRLSKWTNEGELVAMRSMYPTASPLYEDPWPEPGWPNDDFSVDHDGRIWVELGGFITAGGSIAEFYSFDSGLADRRFHGQFSFDEMELTSGKGLVLLAGDAQLDLLYELHRNANCGALGGPCPPNYTRYTFVVRNASAAGDLTTENGLIGRIPVEGLDAIGAAGLSGGIDLKIDSRGNVYLLNGFANRVHKFSATVRNDAGEWVLGEQIGWMGSCTTNLLDPNGVPFNGCDEQLGVSRGYACTDATCGRAASTAGAEAGQFDNPRSIEIDPRDILYVADTGNSRVQRFGPDGTFAGEAKSTGSGVNQGDDPGFILGNMGQPKQLAVNSSSFYVMEPDPQNGDNFVHVFKTIPFYDVTDASAKVKYVSVFDFQGNDGFTYVANDGIARSPPAPVSVTVTRAFRPPERLRSQCFADATLAQEIACTVPEDGNVVIRLSAADLDGFLSTGGLDTLAFDVLEGPVRGTLALLSTTDNAAVYRYTPAANFNGEDALSFDAFDGVAASLEHKTVELTITPTPDPVTIEFPATLRAARGFPQIFTANYNDIDADLASASLATLQWGDGVTASGPGWADAGRRDPNGRAISPQEDFGLGRGLLIASHAYNATGNYAFRVTMTNAPAGSLPNTVATANVEVIEATMVGAKLDAPAQPVAPGAAFPLVVDVTNHVPSGWAGLTAGDTQLSIAPPAGLTLLTLDSRCTAGVTIVCALGNLTPGQAASLAFSARIDLAAARAESVYDLELQVVDDGPKLQSKNLGLLTIRVADRDEDGSIDVDDAFPDDPRYAVDTDDDGLPDEWELDHGLNPAVADADTDGDGDGFTLLQEFANGSYPLLGERQTAAPGATLATTSTTEDRFGIAIAGGDLNQDGYADTVIGAPLHGGPGAVFIAYGSEDGASTSLVRIGPSAGMSAFGRSVAVADFDGNGFPDIGIGSNNAVSIHVNNGQILSTPDFVLPGATAQSNFGVALATGDLDGDGAADLAATGIAPASNGHVQIYFSRRGFAAAPLAYSQFGANFSESAAIADLDGDGAADLLVGGFGQIHGFRAAHNDWQTASTLTLSFVLNPPAPANTFGFSLATGADIRGDGIVDLVVGQYTGAGRILVYDSATNYWITPLPSVVSTVPPSQVINGLDGGSLIDGFGDQLGVAVALGHLDTDAYADVVVGANRAGLLDQGQIQIFRGSPAGLVAATPQIERGTTPRETLGRYVAIPGDVNGDGFADIAAGAPRPLTAQNPVSGPGYVRVYPHAFVAIDPTQDPDGDGVPTALDNCPAVANTNQADLDSDGVGNVCDTDADGDGFFNATDTCPLLASSDQTNSDADALGNLCDGDDDNDDVLDADDRFPLDARYAADTDGDGLPDEYETQHGLNPASAADALADLDADGRSNLDEFRAGTDIAADDVAPAVAAPADVVVSSIGAYTQVALGAATATDAKDGALAAAPSDTGPYVPGRHVIEWRARDAAGNEAVDTQQVDVIPRLDFLGAEQYTAEGATASVTAKLNGEPVSYPVDVPYTIGGSTADGVDYFVSGSLTITGGTSASLDFAIATDAAAEGEETIVVTMGTPVNAVLGNTTEHVVRIVETNLAPRIGLRVAQAGMPRSTIVAGDGPVAMTIGIDDPNVTDSHVIDWSGTTGALVPNEGLGATTFTFAPAGLSPGLYAVRVRVTDNGSPTASATVERLLTVVATAPVLAADVDSDADGIDDAAEGLADVNQNGSSDYLEATKDSNVLTALTGGRRVLQTPAGITLVLGSAAIASGADASVSLADVANHGNGGQPALNAADNTFDYPTGLYDFEVHGLAAAGDATRIVIALPAALPAQGSYRKYVSPLGWREFAVDASNQLASAPGSLAACPAPGSNAYVPGLNAGHYCVQLTIQDGGPNDADGAADRVIRDPGGAAIRTVTPAVTVTALTASNRTVSVGATNVVVLRLRLTSNSTDVAMNAFSLTASGSGNDTADVRAVKVWVDANRDGAVDALDTQIGTGVYQTDNGNLRIQLAPAHTLAFGDTDLLVTYDL